LLFGFITYFFGFIYRAMRSVASVGPSILMLRDSVGHLVSSAG